MGLLLLLVAAGVGWGLWSGKLTLGQLLPIGLLVAGAVLALRGSWLIGLPAAAIGGFWLWGMTSRLSKLRQIPSSEYELAAARWLLGVSANDGPEKIRERHKELVERNAKEQGGGSERTQELNKARDLLLSDLERKKG